MLKTGNKTKKTVKKKPNQRKQLASSIAVETTGTSANSMGGVTGCRDACHFGNSCYRIEVQLSVYLTQNL